MTEQEDIVDRLMERRKLKYSGGCKCGNCQLVDMATLDSAIRSILVLRQRLNIPGTKDKIEQFLDL